MPTNEETPLVSKHETLSPSLRQQHIGVILIAAALGAGAWLAIMNATEININPTNYAALHNVEISTDARDDDVSSDCSLYESSDIFSTGECAKHDKIFCEEFSEYYCVDGVKGIATESDTATACYRKMSEASRSALGELCSKACEEGWGMYAVWSILGNDLEAACAGTLSADTISAPSRRLWDRGQNAPTPLFTEEVTVSGETCDEHARCSACDSTSDSCAAIVEAYHAKASGRYAAASLTDATSFKGWCDLAGYKWGADHYFT